LNLEGNLVRRDTDLIGGEPGLVDRDEILAVTAHEHEISSRGRGGGE